MHRLLASLSLLAVLLGCDPVTSTTLRLTPSPAPSGDGFLVDSAALRTEAISAIEQVVRQFGLNDVDSPGCVRAWRIEKYYPSDQRLTVCVPPPTKDALVVNMVELITPRWTPKADSLRVALLETMGRFGRVQGQP